MNKLILTAVSVSAVSSAFGQAPITLGNTNMPGNGDTLRYTEVQVTSAGNYTATGTNYNWDFSAVVPLNEGVRSFKSAASTPYFFLFMGASEFGEKIDDTLGAGPLVITNYYNFYRKTITPSNAFVADGVGLTFSSVPVPSYYTDKDELYIFPLTYPQYDSSTFRFSTPNSTLIPIRYSKAGYRVTKVDGWGTVTTPYGTENCLRLVTTQYSRDTIRNNIIPFPIGFPNYVRSYQWLTLNSKIPYFEVSGNLTGNNFTPSQARYRGSVHGKIDDTGINEWQGAPSLAIYPNPATDLVFISSAPVKSVTIYDLTGRLVTQLLPETGVIDVSSLEPGTYILSASGFAPQRFVKE
jgi:hypothetical protein